MINASQQLHKGQGMSEPQVILPWFPFWGICVLTAVSPCSICSHSSAPRSPQPILAALDCSRQLSPADGHGGCRRNAGGIRLSCFISCCLGQIPTLCQFLGASNCCSLWGTDVVSSVASVQPPDTSAEENSAHYIEWEFVLSRRHCFFSHLTIAGTVNRNVGTWLKILSLCTKPCAALFTLQPPGLKPRSSSKNWLEKLLPACVLTDEMAGLCRTGHISTRFLLYCGVISGTAKASEKGL